MQNIRIAVVVFFANLFFANLLFAGCAQAQRTSPGALHLTQNGKTSYVIAVANDAIPSEKTAAE